MCVVCVPACLCVLCAVVGDILLKVAKYSTYNYVFALNCASVLKSKPIVRGERIACGQYAGA